MDGELCSVPFRGREDVLTPEDTRAIVDALLSSRPHLKTAFEADGAADCALSMPGGDRFRVNVFSARGNCSVVLRALPSEIPTAEALGLPPTISEISKLKNGLALVVGSTGSGKSTTLAAVIDAVNCNRKVHVVTLEDPVEFVHPHKLATVNQRELGLDFQVFAHGLKAALRQAPKVILVGEIRDRETMEIALKAAETGHLMLSTLHTIDAGQTVGRIVGMFEEKERELVRARLAETLRFVVAQRLLPREGGGRVAALEIMGTSLRIRELITQGETPDKTFRQVIAEARPRGWQTFDQHICEHFSSGLVSTEVAMSCASDPSFVRQELDRIRATRGDELTSEFANLEMAELKPAKR
jgi:twitching motility protein PilT